MQGLSGLRIAYGVMGYGRGHATRVRSVLPDLMRRHEVTVFAGGDAVPVLEPLAPLVRIPTLGYVYGAGGRLSVGATIGRNAGLVSDLMLGGGTLDALAREFRDRRIDLVISDSEAWTHRAAARLRIPRISFDHVGVIAWCEPHFPPELWARAYRDGWGYRRLMGRPDRTLITSFYPARSIDPRTRVIGPVLRAELEGVVPTDGDALLVYLNRGRDQYTPALDLALRRLDARVIVYGTAYRGRIDNLEFRAPANLEFIRELAACRGVACTAGNQLIGEALHFRKPVLALPEDVFEQQLNAHMVERMGVGARGRLAALTVGDIEEFLAGREGFRARMPDQPVDGRGEALATLERFIGELAGGVRRRTASRNGHAPLAEFTHPK